MMIIVITMIILIMMIYPEKSRNTLRCRKYVRSIKNPSLFLLLSQKEARSKFPSETSVAAISTAGNFAKVDFSLRIFEELNAVQNLEFYDVGGIFYQVDFSVMFPKQE